MATAPSQDTARLLALVVDAQHKLAQLESTAKGLIDGLAGSGAQVTPRLRDLLASGERLVAEVQAAGAELAPRLPPGGALPAAPNRATVEAVWERELQPPQEVAVLLTAVQQPAASLGELAASLAALPGCRLQLLRGRQPAAGQPSEASAVLLHCGRAFSAVVHLQQPGSLEPLRVGVLSAAEAAAALATASDSTGFAAAAAAGAAAGRGSLWAPSQHGVFQQLSQQAAAALEHFMQQQQQRLAAPALQQHGQAGQPPPASALELLLLWLATCGDLFSRSSSSSSSGGGGGSSGGGSGGLLLVDAAGMGGGQVLTLRRPCGLSWGQLWEAALNPHLRQAEPAAWELGG